MIDIQDEIIKAITLIVENEVKKLKNNDIETKILATNSDSTYKVRISNVEYDIKNGTNINFKVGDRVLVHLINGNFNNKVIIAKL